MEQNVKTIAFACDHGGFLIKDAVINHLQKKGYEVIDFGTNSSDSVDYPVYAEPCCRSIVAGKADLGILICGTGIGMSIAANKIHGIRAACCGDTYSAAMTRNHNNANVLCLGARVWVKAWLWKSSTHFLPTPLWAVTTPAVWKCWPKSRKKVNEKAVAVGNSLFDWTTSAFAFAPVHLFPDGIPGPGRSRSHPRSPSASFR